MAPLLVGRILKTAETTSDCSNSPVFERIQSVLESRDEHDVETLFGTVPTPGLDKTSDDLLVGVAQDSSAAEVEEDAVSTHEPVVGFR